MKVKTTYIDADLQKQGFDLTTYLQEQSLPITRHTIFDLYRDYQKVSSDVHTASAPFIRNSEDWFLYATHLDEIKKLTANALCDYDTCMHLVCDENGNPVETPMHATSYFVEPGTFVEMYQGIWRRLDSNADNFAFDSEAEAQWAQELEKLTRMFVKGQPFIKRVDVTEDGVTEDRALLGKNFYTNSPIKFAYYRNGPASSCPDFILKDYKDRIHLFESKSLNKSSKMNFDGDEYREKIRALQKAYKRASELTGHIFYIPVLEDAKWSIHCYNQGRYKELSLQEFREMLKSDKLP